MLKVISCEDINLKVVSEEHYNEIINLFKEYDGKLYKWDKDDTIYFKESNTEDIKSLLNATKFEPESIGDYIKSFDHGQDLRIGYHTIVYIGDCIKELQKNINSKEVTDRLMNSDNIKEEINVLIKEQAYKVFLDFVKNGFEIIDNGNFEWL